MSALKYKWIIYLISGVILATLVIQSYWIQTMYESGKQQLINEIQESLDVAIEKYFTLLVQQSTISNIVLNSNNSFNFSFKNSSSDQQKIEVFSFHDTLSVPNNSPKKTFSSFVEITSDLNGLPEQKVNRLLKTDTLQFIKKSVESITSKVLVSFSQDSVSVKKIDSLIQLELDLKNIQINHNNGIWKVSI